MTASEARRKIFQSNILSNEENRKIVNEILSGITKEVGNLNGDFTYYNGVPDDVIEYFKAEGYRIEQNTDLEITKFKWL